MVIYNITQFCLNFKIYLRTLLYSRSKHNTLLFQMFKLIKSHQFQLLCSYFSCCKHTTMLFQMFKLIKIYLLEFPMNPTLVTPEIVKDNWDQLLSFLSFIVLLYKCQIFKLVVAESSVQARMPSVPRC